MRRLLLTFLVSFLLPHPLPSAYADDEQFTLNGKVLDSSRSPLPGARVTAVPDHVITAYQKLVTRGLFNSADKGNDHER